MELDELKQTWSEHARKLDRLLSLNVGSFKTAHLDKTRSVLGSFRLYVVFEMLVGLVLLLGSEAYIADRCSVPTLAIPAFIFALFVLAAVIGDIRELVLLAQINYSEPVTAIQRKLGDIELHFLRTIRLMVLMLPLYMVYVVLGLNLLFGWNILAQGDRAFLWTNLIVSLAFVGPAFWLFRNLRFENIGNPVIRLLLHGGGGKQIIAAMESLKALEEFKAEGETVVA